MNVFRGELIPMSEEQKRPPEGREENLSGGDAFKVDLYFWLQALVMALVSLILLFTFVGRVIGVQGSSMVPTLHDKDMRLLQSMGYEPKPGDIVVLTKESFMPQPIVKRVIAVGGQTVDIDYESNTVYVDGKPINQDFILEPMVQPSNPAMQQTYWEVPEGSIFVMGDNRNKSSDSRDPRLGTVDVRYVLGRARFVLLPFQDFGVIE